MALTKNDIVEEIQDQLYPSSAHPEVANLADIFVERKILFSKYQPYASGKTRAKIGRAPRSQRNLPISGWTLNIFFAIAFLICLAAGCSGDGDNNFSYESEDGTFLCQTVEEPENLQVNLPADEAPHHETMEWWYWTGHLVTDEGRWFGFEHVFFLVNHLDQWGQVAHHAVTDIQDNSFHFVDLFELNRPDELQNGYRLDIDPLYAEGGNGTDVIHGSVDDYTLDLELRAIKFPVYQHGNGYTDYTFGGYTYYYSRERMDVCGTITNGEEEFEVTGTAWFDHQWGETLPAIGIGWDWFALQLDDNREIMIFIIRTEGEDLLVGGSYTESDCSTEEIESGEVEIRPLGEWTSPESGCTYPMGWELEVKDMNFRITPVLQDQELRTSIITYWEGAATISGDASGRAYIELTGYCNP